MTIVFDHKVDEAANISTFFFKPERTLRFTAGQFIELSLPHEHEDDRGHKRWFTISSSPTEELISITTKFASDKGSSYKNALQNLKPNTKVKISEPLGDFVLPKLVQTPLVFIAGGIGITPFHSIFSWLATTNETRPIKFIYGVRNEEEIVFQETMNRAGVAPTIVVSQPSESWGGETGNITAEMIQGLENISEETLIYISGPEPMVNALVKGLKAAGIPKQQLVMDGFSGYSEV